MMTNEQRQKAILELTDTTSAEELLPYVAIARAVALCMFTADDEPLTWNEMHPIARREVCDLVRQVLKHDDALLAMIHARNLTAADEKALRVVHANGDDIPF